jgi:hypothetical protein
MVKQSPHLPAQTSLAFFSSLLDMYKEEYPCIKQINEGKKARSQTVREMHIRAEMDILKTTAIGTQFHHKVKQSIYKCHKLH